MSRSHPPQSGGAPAEARLAPTLARSPTVVGDAGNYAILDEFLRDCCLELMADYGLQATSQLDATSSEPPAGTSIAAIDFSGPDVRGTIALRMTASVIHETYRAALRTDSGPAPVEAADWACELVNQLMGRLKNKLRSYQVAFNVNGPRLLGTFPAAERDGVLRRRFVCEGGHFAGYLDAMIAPGVTFVASSPAEPLVDEGEMVLF